MRARADLEAVHRVHPMAQAELARRVRLTRQSIGEALKGPLAPARLAQARIDAAHPAVIAWAAERGVSAAALLAPIAVGAVRLEEPAPATTSAQPLRAVNEMNEASAPTNVDGLMNLTVRQVTARFGSLPGFIDWLDAAKKIADTQRVQLANDQTNGRLIPRELVRTHVFSHIEESTRRLLQDAATTIARRLYAAAKAGMPVEEAENTVREIISSHLRPLKASTARVLRGREKPEAAE